MKIEMLAEMLKKSAGVNLISFIAYGSYAAGDRRQGSDINTLLVLKTAGTADMDKISGAVRKWQSAGNPAPLIFTKERIAGSADIFPMEFMDIKENNVLLAGEDLFKKLKISPKNLRLETERELQGALIRLRLAYINTAGNPRKITELMRNSAGTFVIMMKSIIRLEGKMAPASKKDIVAAVPERLGLDRELFYSLLSEKTGVSAGLFGAYLAECEKIRDYVENHKTKNRPGR